MVKVGTYLNKEFEKGSEIQITSLVLALLVPIPIFDERQRILNFQEGVRGRYSVAARDIAPGEILLVESEPAAWFLSWDKASTNCQHCCGAIQKQREDRMMMMNGIIDLLFQVQASLVHYVPQEKPD